MSLLSMFLKMDEKNGSSSSLPPFLTKTYEMVNDSSSDSIVSWSDNNDNSFIVNDPMEFSRDLLPKYFKHKNFSSFIRQLNTYGFRKIDPDKWEFSNDDFVRDKPYLMKNIHRRKPVHSHSLQTQNPLTESERQNMEEQIERLEKKKELLLLELQSQEKEKKGSELQVTTLKDRLKHMEKRQETIVSFVSTGLSLNLETLETQERRKRKLVETFIVDPEQVEKLESSLTFWENLVTESSMDLDAVESSLSVGDSRPGLDMNVEPVNVVAMAAPKTGVNDVFWEKLLTENPGSIEQQEVQSERKDDDVDKSSNKNGDESKFWWNPRNVSNNNITEKA